MVEYEVNDFEQQNSGQNNKAANVLTENRDTVIPSLRGILIKLTLTANDNPNSSNVVFQCNA